MTLQHRSLCRARDLLTHAPASTLADAAREAAMSPYHFIRRFEAVFGLTPRQYRIAARIDRAKRLLAQGDLSVTDVCLEVGFASLGTFSDLFHRRTGEPPSTFRRRARITVPEILFPGCLTLLAYAWSEPPARHAGIRAGILRNSQEAPPAATR
jgi:AraC-like DNA-binding protein